ncbi:hypothetical protein [Pontibacillus salipaludis]|uniref:Uncharacterized protein n=1 Tax=Pontibacillus salipaludis TaxID=1697394 RepID=A0ABQ1Q1L2_9BACI|nr:hypothetical protein [Pontibacillus salipaludis]GGD10005.1 hypothetical protein GCM10011389_16920 [Pontibacillus salipaludis]
MSYIATRDFLEGYIGYLFEETEKGIRTVITETPPSIDFYSPYEVEEKENEIIVRQTLAELTDWRKERCEYCRNYIHD